MSTIFPRSDYSGFTDQGTRENSISKSPSLVTDLLKINAKKRKEKKKQKKMVGTST